MEEFTRCKNFKIWYIKNLKKKRYIDFVYDIHNALSLATVAFISKYRISRFNGEEGGGWGEGGGCKVWNRFCNNHPRGNFTALEICRWQFSRLRIVWMEISRVELVLVPIEYMSTEIFFMLTFNSSKLMFWRMLKETRNSFKKWHFTPHLNVKKL